MHPRQQHGHLFVRCEDCLPLERGVALPQVRELQSVAQRLEDLGAEKCAAGQVKLGFRNELAAIEDADERKEMFETMVARMYKHGKAVNMASHFEIDDVIDPAESRRWISRALESLPPEPGAAGRRRPCVDTW